MINKKLIRALHRILAGDVIKFPSERRKEDIEKKAKPQDKWTEVDINEMKKRFKDKPEILKHLKKAADPKKHTEPYTGGPASTKWGDYEGSDAPFALPSNVGDLQGVLGKDALIGGQDPFAWLDAKYKVSLNLLIKNVDNPLDIHTRSDLIAHDDYIAALNPNKHKVHMHIISTNEDFNRRLEPNQPSALRRILAAKKLRESGVPITIVHDVFENKNLHPSVEKLNKLDQLKMQRLASGVKVKAVPVKISDKAAKIVNDLLSQDEKIAV